MGAPKLSRCSAGYLRPVAIPRGVKVRATPKRVVVGLGGADRRVVSVVGTDNLTTSDTPKRNDNDSLGCGTICQHVLYHGVTNTVTPAPDRSILQFAICILQSTRCLLPLFIYLYMGTKIQIPTLQSAEVRFFSRTKADAPFCPNISHWFLAVPCPARSCPTVPDFEYFCHASRACISLVNKHVTCFWRRKSL